MNRFYISAMFLMIGGMVLAQKNVEKRKMDSDSTKVSQLSTVEIIGRKETSYKNTNSFSGTKVNLALKDTPQSIGYVTKELILDQNATTVNDVVKNISGINQYSFYNDFSIRGNRVMGNKVVGGGMLLNGMKAQTSFWKPMSLANIERVEVIKGPASAMFGNASPGGVINRITKKPLATRMRSITTSIGSFNTLKTYADFTGPANKSKTLLYRLNLGYETTDTFRDLQSSKNIIIAPSFSYLPTDKTRLNIDIFYRNMNGKLDRAQSVFGEGDLYSTPISQSLSAANDYLKENFLNLTTSLVHQFSDNLTFNSVYLHSSYDEDLQEHRQANAYVSKVDGKTDYSKIVMTAQIRKRNFRNNSFNNFFNLKVNTGEVKHNILLGYDYYLTQMLPSSSEMQAGGYLLKNGKTTNKFDKTKIGQYVLDADGNPKTNVPYFDLTKGNTGNGLKDISKYIFEQSNMMPTTQYSHGVYLQEQLEYKFLKLLLSGRIENFNDEIVDSKTYEVKKVSQTAFIPRIGLVAEVNKNINLYATWVKGFEPQSGAIQSDPEKFGGPFDPEYSRLYEVGMKSEWFQKRLSATVAIFNLKKMNALYAAPIENYPDRMEQIGEEVSKGIELDIAGFITPNWSIVANYSYNDAKITKTKDGKERDFGMQRPNTPRHSGNLWTKYIIGKGIVKGLGFGAGYNFVTERYGQVAKRSFPITYPSYGIVDVALYYKVQNIQLQANLNNVFNKIHWVGGYDKLRSFPGAPRNVSITVSYKF